MISKNQIKYVHQLELKKFRKQEGLFIAEGHKVVGDLLRAGFKPRQIFAIQEWITDNTSLLSVLDSQLTEVNLEELTRLSLLQHPQQVLALFPIPDEQTIPSHHNSLSLLLDNVQDPGNLGTIIRIAGLVSIPFIAAWALSTLGIPKWFKPRWAA